MTLTRHPPGSLRELWALSFPLMLSSLSVMTMLFIDRLLLARFSQDAFNAAVSASTLGWSLVLGWMVLTSITEVFVAQMHGRGRSRSRLEQPVWQMIWLSLASFAFFFPLSRCGGCWFYGEGLDHSLQRDYLGWMLFFGPSYPLYGALSGFFVGQGRVKIITLLSLFANLVNALLDGLLIFGIEGWIAPLGVKGAAIATSGSQLFQAFALGFFFLRQSELSRRALLFRPKLFWSCFKIGFPGALFATFEILGWAAFYMMMAQAGPKHITLAGVCQSLVILFYFFGEGIGKGMTAVAANRIGQRRSSLVQRSLHAGLKLHLLFFVFLLALFAGFSYPLILLFAPESSSALYPEFFPSLKTCLFFSALYLFFEGVRMLFSGALTAAGDTRFLLFAGSLSVWAFLVLPVYYLIVLHGGSIELAQAICALYALTACLIYTGRFRSGKWKSLSLLD